MQSICVQSPGQTGHCLSSCRYVAGAPSRRARVCTAHGKRRKSKPQESMDDGAPEMTEGVKASFYLRFCDVLGEDPSTAMRKIVDGARLVYICKHRALEPVHYVLCVQSFRMPQFANSCSHWRSSAAHGQARPGVAALCRGHPDRLRVRRDTTETKTGC